MIPERRQYFLIVFFIYLLFSCSGNRNASAGFPILWIDRPLNFTLEGFSSFTPPILEGYGNPRFHCGFSCYFPAKCFLSVYLLFPDNFTRNLVWSANRNHPVKVNSTLQLGQDGNLVLVDSDGTLVWSTNTTGKSVSGLNLTETGNLVLFDKANRTIWQSFDHPTDCLLPGQNLVSGQKLTANVSAYNLSQGLFSLSVLNRGVGTYIDSDPPQFYYTAKYGYHPYYRFDGHTLTAFPGTDISARFMKLEFDGHLRVYIWDVKKSKWKDPLEIWSPFVGNCGYPMVCGRYSICTNNGQCDCPVEGNFFKPSISRNGDIGCTELKSISCDSLQYHSLLELKSTTYFSFETEYLLLNKSMLFEDTKLEDCKMACLRNCSCKAVVWGGIVKKNCLLLNEVFSIRDIGEGNNSTSVFLKVQNSSIAQNQSAINSGGKNSRPSKVIIGSTLAASLGIILSITTCFVLFKRRSQSRKDGDLLDLEPILPGILTRFSYNELKIVTQDFSRKLGKGGFGSVYEGTLSNGTKIAVKHLDGVDQVKESFLTEVKTVGGIHHINLVKLIGYCAEKSHRLLIYEYMVNGSLDRWITQENGLTWNTRKMVISDIAKGLAYLHEDCSHKIIHLDIKPQNILLDQNFNAKLSDFGLSKLIEKDKSKVVTRMRGTPGYLAPEWLSSVITEKVDVYAFGIVLLEILCGRKNLDWSQTDEEDVHLLSVFTRKAEQEQLTDMVDRNEDMQLHREAVTEMMSLAAWCLQGDFSKRPSMSLVVKALEGLVTVETNLDYNFRNVPKLGAGNQPREATISSKLPSVLSGPR